MIIQHPLRRSLPFLCGALLLPASVFAQSATPTAAPAAAPAPAAPPAAAPAPGLGTAANPIVVPAGCSAATQGGQVVVICPPAGSSTPAPATAAPAVLAPTSAAPPAYTPVPVREEKKWYGWQTLIVDGATVVTTIGVAPASSSGAAAVFWSGYLLGGPIVHWSNGQLGKGFASLGIRVGAPLVLGFTGALIGASGGGDRDSNSDDVSAAAVGAAVGILAGYVTAVAIDAAVLARKTVKVSAEAERRSRNKVKWSPTAGYDPKQRSFSMGVGGTF